MLKYVQLYIYIYININIYIHIHVVRPFGIAVKPSVERYNSLSPIHHGKILKETFTVIRWDGGVSSLVG